MSDELAFLHGRTSRRDALKFAAAALTLLVTHTGARAAARQTSVLAVRVWPARDYTRITLEYSEPLKYSFLQITDPERLVVDLEGVEFNSVLQNLPGRISETDPYIKLIRAGRNKPGVVRLVIELKGGAGAVKPQMFALAPVGEYAHRLVLDLYPSEPVDPLLSLLENDRETSAKGQVRENVEQREKPASEKRVAENSDNSDNSDNLNNSGNADNASNANISRLITIVLDPGHGGEDPGAIGRGGNHEKDVTLSIARRLKAKIDAEKNMRTVLTRDGDYFIPLQQRVQKARRLQADLFVSVHADAFIKPSARGSSVLDRKSTRLNSSHEK